MRTGSSPLSAVMVFLASSLVAQSPAPQTYTVNAELNDSGTIVPIAIYRDGPKERIEITMGSKTLATIFDFEAHRVYWIGWFGTPCTGGHYTSARAPIDQDLVSGGVAGLQKLAPGRNRTVVRSETVNGIPARLEEIAGTRPASSTSAWPTRVWLAEQGDFPVKIEGFGENGKPAVLFEIKQFGTEKPSPELLVPPANCPMTNSEMDETGLMRAHAESRIEVETTGSIDLGSKATQGKAKAPSDAAPKKRPSTPAKK